MWDTVTFEEKPRKFEAFFFAGGIDGPQGFKQLLIWLHNRGFMAAYVPDLMWEVDSDPAVAPRKVEELVYVRNRGYIKGSPEFTMEINPKRWVILGLDGSLFMMTQEAVEGRFVASDVKALHLYDQAIAAQKLYQEGGS
jgi:hypothetical protein